jgi:NAD(P)-dependent dehydrogenase (short-subunit alcohol dehydrogenase family)
MSTVTTTLITGGIGGICLEMARILAARGHRLVKTRDEPHDSQVGLTIDSIRSL